MRKTKKFVDKTQDMFSQIIEFCDYEANKVEKFLEEACSVREQAGRNAQRVGFSFEKDIVEYCSSYGFEIMKEKDYNSHQSSCRHFKKILIEQPAYGDIGKKGRQDFLLKIRYPKTTHEFKEKDFKENYHKDKELEILIQCKCQMTKGSVDEKIYHFLRLLEKNKIIQNNVIFLHHGNGIRQNIIDELKSSSLEFKKNGTYNLQILDLEEFKSLIVRL